MSSEYDIEKYDREREERIKHLETLREQADEEFNSYHNEKRESFEYDVEDNSSAKRKLIGVATLALLGFAGYLGYSQLNSNNSSKLDANNSNQNVISNQNQTKQQSSDVRNQIETIVSTAMKKKEQEKDNIAQEVNVIDVSKMVEKSKCIDDKSMEDNRPIVTENSKKTIEKVEVVESIDKNRTSDNKKEKLDNTNSIVDKVKEEISTKNIEKVEEKKEDVKQDEETNRTVEKVEVVEKSKEVKKEHISKKVRKKPNFIVIRVREGDTLASLSEKYYGNPMYYKRILRANKGLRENHLVVGERIIIPELDRRVRERLYRIRKGDTLYKISKRFYGTTKKVQKIIEANYKIKSESSRLNVGDLIYIPR
jgi:nucleoid-associated protein YgaU